MKDKLSTRKKITKVRVEINKIEIKETIVKNIFFEKITKIGKPLSRLTKKKTQNKRQCYS